jgi:hypothetical protein
MIEQRIQRSNVIAAGRPMQRGLGMTANERSVHIGAVGQEGCHGRRTRPVARPICGYVEQRPLTVYPGLREIGIPGQEPLQRWDVARVDGLNGGDGQRIISADIHGQSSCPSWH